MQNVIKPLIDNEENDYDWRTYQFKSYELIGDPLANKLKSQKYTWKEVYEKARKIYETRQRNTYKTMNDDKQNAIIQIYKDACYELLGETRSEVLKSTTSKEWYQIYDQALNIWECNHRIKIQAMIDAIPQTSNDNEYEEVVNDTIPINI